MGKKLTEEQLEELRKRMYYVSIPKYAENDSERETLKRILNGKATGEKRSKKDTTRNLIRRLKADGFWVWDFPWEE